MALQASLGVPLNWPSRKKKENEHEEVKDEEVKRERKISIKDKAWPKIGVKQVEKAEESEKSE